jgi:hypothetical protein
MLDITAANTRNLPTKAAPAASKGFATKEAAKRAAVATLGPQARHQFEYDTSKVDGVWFWRPCEDVRPPTAAELKANGGKKAFAEAGGASSMAGAPKAGQPTKTNGRPSNEDDGLDIPASLRRALDTAEARAARVARDKRLTGPDRVLKTPKSSPKEQKKGRQASTKTALIGTMLTRAKGCTGAEVLKATGWVAVSMPAQAKLLRMKLRKEKTKGQPTRYFGVPK